MSVERHGKPVRTSGGQLDVYQALRLADFTDAEIASVCTSARSGVGPTESEVRAGDYRNFPYARITTLYDPADALRTAILWDSSPQSGGRRLVGLDDGTTKWVLERQFATFLAQHSH